MQYGLRMPLNARIWLNGLETDMPWNGTMLSYQPEQQHLNQKEL